MPADLDRKLAEIAGRGGPDAVRLVAVLREQRDELSRCLDRGEYCELPDWHYRGADAAALAALEGE